MIPSFLVFYKFQEIICAPRPLKAAATPCGWYPVGQPGTGQHESRMAIREAAYHTSAAADLPVQSFNHIIGADSSPVLTGKIAVSQSLLNAILHFLIRLFQLHGAQLFHHSFGLFAGSPFTLLSLKGDSLKFWYLEGDTPGNGNEVAVIVATVVPWRCSLRSYRAARVSFSASGPPAVH